MDGFYSEYSHFWGTIDFMRENVILMNLTNIGLSRMVLSRLEPRRIELSWIELLANELPKR